MRQLMPNSRVRTLIVIAVATVGAILTTNRVAAQSVRYDWATGNVTFLDFRNVNGVRVFSSQALLIPNAGSDLGFAINEQTASYFGWLSFAPGISGTELNAGNIVQPVGYSERFHLTADYHLGEGPILQLPVHYVPEPSTVLLGVGAFVVVAFYAGLLRS